jgi:hypothetical protein
MERKDIDTRRQSVLYAEQAFTVADLVNGEAVPVIYLKPGTRILRGFLDITTAFDSDTSDAIEVGDTVADDVDKYLTSTSVASTGLTALTGIPANDGAIDTGEALTITWTGTGSPAATAGAGVLTVEYVEDGRQTEVHTYRG